MPAFYDTNALEQIAINLFYGWGYNFYRKENQLRADDLLVRSRVVSILGAARKSVDTAESVYRREFLPPPSREKPRHDPAALANAQALERLSKAIGAVAGLISALPAPENDRMTQRYRTEAATLQQLLQCDQMLVGQAELLRTTLDQQTGPWLIENNSTIQEGLTALGETLRNRKMLLLG